jgi:hypothetical protein
MIIFVFLLPSFLYLLTVRGQSFFVKKKMSSSFRQSIYSLSRSFSSIPSLSIFARIYKQLIDSSNSQYHTIMLLYPFRTMKKPITLFVKVWIYIFLLSCLSQVKIEAFSIINNTDNVSRKHLSVFECP